MHGAQAPGASESVRRRMRGRCALRASVVGRQHVDVAPGLGARLVQHLDHFLISEQVEFADRTADFAQMRLAGPEAPAVLTRAAGYTPWQVRQHDNLGLPGYDILCPRDAAVLAWQALVSAGARPAGR